MNFLFFILFSTSLFANVITPEKGLYICKQDNEDSICDQELRPYFENGRLVLIKVDYVGWCGHMGPYTYFCHDEVCEDLGLKFIFRDSKHYYWENKQYNYHCEFEKK